MLYSYEIVKTLPEPIADALNMHPLLPLLLSANRK